MRISHAVDVIVYFKTHGAWPLLSIGPYHTLPTTLLIYVVLTSE